MKRSARHLEADVDQMLFTYRRTVTERFAPGDLRDASAIARTVGFRWPLAVSERLWHDVETVPTAYQRTETARARWQHLLVLAATAAAQLQREAKEALEINVVLRTSDATERSREHIKTLVLRREKSGDAAASQSAAATVFTLGHKGE